MPIYMLHTRGSEPETGDAYPTRDDAVARLQADRLSSTHKISVLPTPEENLAWREREDGRFSDGTYLPVPFAIAREPRHLRDFSGEYARHPTTDSLIILPSRPYYPDHYVHLSLKHPGMLAYTKSIEHGLADRQTIVRPGSYLDQFYGDIYTAAERAAFAAQIAALGSGLKIATTADDIERVYRGGPNSCMSHRTGNYSGEEHPTRVYGDSDLAVAYYGDIAHVSARAVVWPDRKLYSRIYGGIDGLRALLESAGYREGSISGARVRAIRFGSGNWIMPYVDGVLSASLSSDGEWFVLGRAGTRTDVSTANTNGLGCDDEEEENHDDEFYCQGCEEHCSEADYGGELQEESYCSGCYRERTTRCEECGNRVPHDAIRECNGNDYCEECFSNLATSCSICDEYFIGQSYTTDERADRTKRHVEDLCLDCGNTHDYCSECEDYYDHPAPPEYVSEDMRIDYRAVEDLIADLRATPPEPRYDAHCAECGRTLTPDAQIPLLRLDTKEDERAIGWAATLLGDDYYVGVSYAQPIEA